MEQQKPDTGFAEFIRLLAFIKKRAGAPPLTTEDVGRVFGWQAHDTRKKLGYLRAVGLIGVKAKKAQSTAKGALLLYGYGADAPEFVGVGGHNTPNRRAQRMARLIQSLRKKPKTSIDLAHDVGMSVAAVRLFINYCMQDDIRLCRVQSWTREGDAQEWTAVFGWGHNADVPKPTPLTKSEINQRDRHRRREKKAIVHRTIARTPNSVFDLARTMVAASAHV